MSDALLITGNLSEIRLPTLLMSLYRSQETGILTVQGESYRKTLFILEGNAVFASSTDPDQRLGETLLKRGVITVPQYVRSAELIRPGKRQGEILLEQGALTSEGLLEGIRQQVYDIIFSLFLQDHGTYTLRMEEFDTLDMITISMEMPLLVARGMARNERFSIFHQEVGHPEAKLRTAHDTPSFLPSLELGSDEEHLLSLCRNGATVGALLDASYLNQFETYRTLWIFLTLGLLTKAGAQEDGVPRASGIHAPTAESMEETLEHYNAIFAHLHRLLAEGADSAEGLIQEALAPLQAAFPALMESQEGIASYGRLDIDLGLSALRSLPESERAPQMKALLDEILYALAFLAERHLPPEKRAAVHEYIRREAANLGGSSP